MIVLDNTLRYVIYGVRPSEHEDDNSDTPSQQHVSSGVVLCSTVDKQEAKDIVAKGGFMHEGQWYAATGAKDTEGGGRIGALPEGI